MLKIGDFARLTRVSIRMLRYYDELGLLKPAHIDTATGYRFYTAQQLPRLNRILALQDLGFGLEHVGQLLREDLSVEQLKGMLRMKQHEVQQRVEAEQERLARVAARLAQIEHEDRPPAYDVVRKDVPAQLVAGVRGAIEHYAAVGGLFEEVLAYLAPYRVSGMPAAIWHADPVEAATIDAEAVVFLREPIPASTRVRVYELPAVTMAAVVHHGPFTTLGLAYDAIVHWIDAQGYRIAGANREIYVHYTLPARQDDPGYVTELQFPIAR